MGGDSGVWRHLNIEGLTPALGAAMATTGILGA